MSKNLVLFDFDGTLTRKDTLILFIRYAKGYWSFLFSVFILSPVFIMNLLGLLSNDRTKMIWLSWHFKGIEKKQLMDLGNAFSRDIIPTILRPSAMNQLNKHIQSSDQVVLVSASFDIWLSPFCKQHGIDLICSQFEFKDERFTGEYQGLNCNHEEKAMRIKKAYAINTFRSVIAYGDSKGDQAMMALANSKGYQIFKD